MDLQITDKVMLVTGGASGIGEAIVRRAAGEGAVPVIVDKDKAGGRKIVNELAGTGLKTYLVAAELGSPDSCRRAAEEALSLAGRIDGLFNNAGINDGVGLEKGEPDDFLRSLAVNLHHYYFMAQACLPALKRTKGAIVNISSKTAVTGQGGTSGYVASKAAQLGLTREWAVELLPYDIRVNALLPAEVMTPLYQKWLKSNFANPDEEQLRIEKQIPLGHRFTRPEEIADMAVFLASGRAGHITGQHIHVDGGYVHLDRACRD